MDNTAAELTVTEVKLKEKIEDLPVPDINPCLFFLRGLCVLFGEDFYMKEADVSPTHWM